MHDQYVKPWDPHKKPKKKEKPIPEVYPVIDNDLARDNLENNIPAADLEDFGFKYSLGNLPEA